MNINEYFTRDYQSKLTLFYLDNMTIHATDSGATIDFRKDKLFNEIYERGFRSIEVTFKNTNDFKKITDAYIAAYFELQNYIIDTIDEYENEDLDDYEGEVYDDEYDEKIDKSDKISNSSNFLLSVLKSTSFGSVSPTLHVNGNPIDANGSITGGLFTLHHAKDDNDVGSVITQDQIDALLRGDADGDHEV